MGSNTSSTPPTAPAAPTAPDYSDAINDAVQADINTLPERNALVLQADENDLTQLAPLEEQNQYNSALSTANAALAVQQQYGQQFEDQELQRAQQADPAGYALRQQLATDDLNQLNEGTSLDPTFQTQLEQQVRGAEAARGNVLGDAAANAENLYVGDAGLQLQQQRVQNAQNYLNGAPLSAQFSQINNSQYGAAPFAPQSYPGGLTGYSSTNPNDASLGTQYALGVYNGENNAYNAGLNYSSNIYRTDVDAPNPWLQGLGLAVQGTNAASNYF